MVQLFHDSYFASVRMQLALDLLRLFTVPCNNDSEEQLDNVSVGHKWKIVSPVFFLQLLSSL